PSVSDDQVLSTLKEIGSQAIAALDPHDLGCLLHLVGGDVGSTPQSEIADAAALTLDIVMNGHEHPLQVMLSGHIEPASPHAELAGVRSQTLDVIMDIDLPLVVRFGRTEL